MTDADPTATPTDLHGRLFGHGPGGGETCRVEVAPDEVIAHAGIRRFVFPLGASRFALGGSRDELLVLEHDAEAGRMSLFLPRAAAEPELRRHAGPEACARLEELGRGQARARRRRTALWVALGVAALLLVGLGLVVVDAAFRFALRRIPPTWEISLGRSLLDRLHPQEERVVDPAVVAGIEAIRARLVEALGPTPYRFEVHVVRSDLVNAFALPGGTIAVHSGLLGRCGSAEELAGVLAHEIQHVRLRHGLEGIARELGWSLVLSLVLGDLGSAEEVIVGQATRLAALANSRDAESEADLAAADLLGRAGIAPEGLARFLETLAAIEAGDPGVMRFLSTHPGGAERAGRLRREALELRFAPRPLEVDWAALSTAASASASRQGSR